MENQTGFGPLLRIYRDLDAIKFGSKFGSPVNSRALGRLREGARRGGGCGPPAARIGQRPQARRGPLAVSASAAWDSPCEPRAPAAWDATMAGRVRPAGTDSCRVGLAACTSGTCRVGRDDGGPRAARGHGLLLRRTRRVNLGHLPRGTRRWRAACGPRARTPAAWDSPCGIEQLAG